MEEQIAKKKIDYIKSEIEYHNNLYYDKNTNEISDFEYDKKLNSLIELEKKFPHLKTIDSPSQRIGGTITKKFETISHDNPMLSLSNTYSKTELLEFDKRVKKKIQDDNIEYICELKYDGVALSLIYKNRILKYALTRGDGKKGDNITNNVYTIKSIPIKLPAGVPNHMEVRGEAFISKNNFKKLNFNRKNKNETLFANPRNAAAGSLKMQDSGEVSKRNLNCYIYSLNTRLASINNHYQALKLLKKYKYNVPNTFKKCNDIQEVIKYIKFWDKEREKIDVETDGIVIKVNNLKQQEKLGFTSKNPRWAIAFKYKSENSETVVKKIKYQVGRTGAITPVAILEPVKLSGSIVKRASLHNFNEIKRLDIRIGDTVIIEKGGEIIPKITGINLSKRIKSNHPIKFISFCPSCNYPLSRQKSEANHYCKNYYHCSPQIQGRIEHFIGKDAMNIENLGPETIKGLIDNKLIKNISDLYDLNFDNLYNLKITYNNSNGDEKVRRLKEKSCQNILKSIEKSKDINFSNILFGLGIRYVGKTTAEKLTLNFKSIDKLIRATYKEIINVDEIGEKIAISVSKFFQVKENLLLISKLKNVGLKFHTTKNINYNSPINNFIFVISGSFINYTRNELKKIIKDNGGKVSSSISKNTNFLLAGKNIGPSKKVKAQNLKINIISETDFNNMLNQ